MASAATLNIATRVSLRRNTSLIVASATSVSYTHLDVYKRQVFYLRDVYDHTVHFIESLEAIRDMLASMLDIYISTLSNRVNMEVRALTVVAMLFMPATLIAGIFGMNTQWLPWHEDVNGFWYVIAIMVGIALVMGLIFWRRQWLNKSRISDD